MARKLTDGWIDAYLRYTDNTEPRELYRTWVAISTIAACMERKCWTHLGDEIVYPNFYIVLIGPAAARKGTAIRPGRQFLIEVGLSLGPNATSMPRLIQKFQTSNQVVNPEGGDLYQHSSITIISHEFTVFLGGDKGHMMSVLSYLCDLYDCHSNFEYSTVGREDEEVYNVFLNLLAATTPTAFEATIPTTAVGTGLTSRTIFVFEESKGKIVPFPTLNEALHPALLHDLQDIHGLYGEFVPTDEFKAAYEAWRYKWEDVAPGNEAHLEHYADRRPVHLHKLALVCAASRASDYTLTIEDFEIAAELLELTEAKMPMVFRKIGADPLVHFQERVAEFIKENGEVTHREIAEEFSHEISAQRMTMILTSLNEMGLTKDIITDTGTESSGLSTNLLMQNFCARLLWLRYLLIAEKLD